MGSVTGWEVIILVVLAVVLLGPERLPDYAAKLARLVRQGRAMAENAKGQLREQIGPEFDDIDWRQYDPRQYDPRRIVREALLDPTPLEERDDDPVDSLSGTGYDPSRPTPYDADAT